MKRTVLVTGATGFVGSQVLRILEEEKVKIHAVVLKGEEQKLSKNLMVEKIISTLDLFSESVEWWSNVCNGIDIVIHIAWYAEPGKYLQSAKNMDCLIGTLQLAKGVVQAGIERFIGIGTCFEYDVSKEKLSINTPLQPLTPYAGAKAAVFMMLSKWLPQHNVEFAWCRLFYLFGEGEDKRRLVPYLRAQMIAGKPAELTSGNQIRDFLDVQDAARMIVDVAFSKKTGAVNICSGIPITVRQVSEKLADEYGRRDLLKFGVRQENRFDPNCVVGIK